MWLPTSASAPDAGRALEAPAHRAVRVAAVVGPVPAAEVQHLAQVAGLDQVPDVGDARGAAEGEADLGDDVATGGCVCCRGHRAGVLQGVAQRLLAQHMLAGGEQTLDHLAVQRVGDHDADHVDVVGLGDRLPGGVVPLVPEAAGGERAELGVHIADRDQPDGRQHRAVQRGRGAIGRGMRPPGHSGADDRDTEAIGHVFSFEVDRTVLTVRDLERSKVERSTRVTDAPDLSKDSFGQILRLLRIRDERSSRWPCRRRRPAADDL